MTECDSEDSDGGDERRCRATLNYRIFAPIHVPVGQEGGGHWTLVAAGGR